MRDRTVLGLSAAATALLAFQLALAPALHAQRRQGGGGGVVRSGGPVLPPAPKPFGNGFGSAVFPGTGGPPGGRIYGGNVVRRGPQGGGGHQHGNNRPPVLLPYPMPVYWGDSFWYGNNTGPAPEPAPPVERPEPAPVIINQYFNSEPINPAMREYRSGELPPAQPVPEPPAPAARTTQPEREQFYMLAFRDGTVQSVRGYSVSGNTISYVTPYGSVRRVALDEFDQEMTEKLNRGR